MDRVRRHPNRRKPFGNPSSTSPQSPSEPSFGRQSSSSSPVMSHAAAASPPQARRAASRPLQHAFTFSTPGSAGRNLNLRKRSKTVDNYGDVDVDADDDDDDDPDGPKKGGHSLRKRARIDYTFEHIDDEVVVPSSTSATRSNKKRRSDGTEDTDFYGPGSSARRRRDSASPDTPSSRRRNPSRKSVEARAYLEEFGQDDPETKDTIEVGGSYSDVDDMAQIAHANPSPDHPIPSSELASNGVSQVDTFFGPFAQNHSQSMKQQTPESAIKTAAAETNKDVQDHDDGPATQLQEESFNVQSKDAEPDRKDDAAPVVDQPMELPASSPPAPTTEQTQEAAKVPEEPVPELSTPTKDEVMANGVEDTTEPSTQLLREPKPDPVIPPQESAEKPATPQPQSESLETIQSGPEAPIATVDNADEAVRESQPLDEPELAAEPEPLAVPMDIDEVPEGQSSAAAPSSSDDSQVSLADVKSTETVPTVLEEPVGTGSTTPPQSISIESASAAQPEKEPLKVVEEVRKVVVLAKSSETDSPSKPVKSSRPQPTPKGRWSHLTPYVDGEYVSYPEKKTRSDDDGATEDQPSEEKDTDKEVNDMEPMVEDNDDTPDAVIAEVPTPALNTPTRGSPVGDSLDPTAFNSPAPAGEDADDADVSESQEPQETRRFFKYRKTRDAEDYISAIENFEQMPTLDLWDVLDACNVSLLQWQNEYAELGRIVDDYENAQRRRQADSKYESRTRNLHQHGVNYDEPDFAAKGYKAKEKDGISETRYLQSQDRIMAATYGFEYDPHPSKIGRQNPETQQVGIMTRGRSLRNQPRQTAKATEADEVVGKRQRKPVQLFDPASQQDVSRSSTPVPTRGRRRKNANMDNDEMQPNITSSFNEELNSDVEPAPPRRGRKPGRRPKAPVPSIVEDLVSNNSQGSAPQEEPKSGRRGRGRQSVKYDDAYPYQMMEEDVQPEPKQPKRMLTLKMPSVRNFSGPSSVITDNGDSRPSTASSDSSTHTAESSYSFRPKRQKRFRDDPDDSDALGSAPPKKRGKRNTFGEEVMPPSEYPTPEAQQHQSDRKVHKIKFVRTAPEPSQNGEPSRNGTPSSQPPLNDEDRKDYKTMTKSEKMSASMKSRWANGNMAGAVEKRKATLAAKKAAQAAAEQRVGPIAPKPKMKPGKKDSPMQGVPAEYTLAIPGVGYPFQSN